MSRAPIELHQFGAERYRADGETDVEQYERAMPFWQSYAGLKRYREKKREAA